MSADASALGGDRAPVVWRLAAADGAALRARLGELTAREGAADRSVTLGDGPVRLAIVEPTARKTALADRLVTKGDQWSGRSDIWFSPAALTTGGGKVAFLFPGVEPAFGASGIALPELADLLGTEPPDVTEDTVAHRSAAIIRLGIFLDRALRALGVRPDLVGGHSIGEWSATVSAGMSSAAAAEALITSVDLDAVELPAVDFAAIVAGADTVAETLAGAEGVDGVEISHDNCGRQSVICGPPEGVARAVAVLGGHNILGQVLDFRSGFHTSALLPALDHLRAHIDAFPLQAPSTPIWSATTCAPLPADLDETRAVITRHLVETVRFRPLIERMYEDGARVFVQPGIGNLVGFVDDVLADRPHAAVPVVTARRPALAQLHRALAALWVEGVETSSPDRPVAPSVRSAPSTPAPAPAWSGGSMPGATPGAGPASAPAERTASAPALDPAAVHPVVAAAAAVLDNAGQATRDVLAAWQAQPVPAGRRRPQLRASPARPAAPPATAPQVMPPVDAAAAAPSPGAPGPDGRPTERFTLTRTLSLETMPEMVDHTLYRQPEGWPDPSDRFPIVAMTSQLELLADIAREHGGGHDVVELSDVRNYRWLDISDPVDLEITVVPEGDDVLRIALGPFCRAKVRLGAYPAPGRAESLPLRAPRPAQKTPEQLWSERLMFHGPRFHGIRRLGPVGDDGIRGELEGMPDPGPLLDNVGKLIAYWTMEQLGWGEAPLPIGVARVEYSGPGPRPGEPVPTEVRITSMDGDFVVGDAVLARPDGTTWCHIDGWRMHIFHRDEVMDPLSRWVEHTQAIDDLGDGLLVQHERWPGTPTRDLLAHQFLRRDERTIYESMTPADRRAWLVEVVAAKEAYRRWARQALALPSFPVQVDVRTDGDGRWVATSPLVPGRALHVALARVEWMVAAVAAEAVDGEPPVVAVDMRPVPEDVDGEEVAAAAAAALGRTCAGAPVHHRVLPAGEVGDNPRGVRAVAWTAPPSPLAGDVPSRPATAAAGDGS